MNIDARLSECGSGPTCPAAYPTDTDRWLIQGRKVNDAMRAELNVPGHEDVVALTPAIIDMIRCQPYMDLEQLGDWLTAGTHVYRLETLDYYSAASDDADFRAYQQGKPGPDRDAKSGWLDWLTDATESGSWRRVRIVRGPLTEYVKFEMDWCYTDNASAGEDIRILDLTEQAHPGLDLDLSDHYIVDGQAAVMAYNEAGDYLYALPVQNPARLIEARDQVWEAAEPFSSWWRRHPEHHRARVAA